MSQNETYFKDTLSSNGTCLYLRDESTNSQKLLQELFKKMRGRGWSIETDPYYLENFSLLAEDHFLGIKGDLKFIAEKYRMGFKIEFFQEINFINKNGARYDFDKLKHMPYLIKCSFLVELNHIKSFCLENGYVDKSEPVKQKAFEKVMKHIKSSCHYELGKELPDFDIPKYNCTDKDGKRIRNGEVKYFRDSKGRLQKGIVYHNINNMWWVILHEYKYSNLADFELFDLDTEENMLRKYIAPSGHHNPKSRDIPTPEQYEVWMKKAKKGGVIQRVEYANDFLDYLYEINWITHRYKFYIKDNGRLGMIELENKVWGGHKVFDKPQQIKLYSRSLPMSSTESSWIVALRNYITSGKPTLSKWFCKDSNGEGSTAHKWPEVRDKAWKIAALAI
ncbi:hypothetical protein M3589_15240 [Heyndrickxia oleronia]|uniref:hypothetical protein n=1 Tax=Heyndrickxia oleronia TaxID=38875 RepID=UPI0020418471|nr:hypothetical protein [Heyndrickxia oleronia]MCM3239077.1 hypothetical protein [Heyndrickxia oleronia]